jgi:Zn-dependent peptidase ImmA (M78 family)
LARRNPYAFAARVAECLVRDELKATRLGIDPIKIAQDRGIFVEPMPETHTGVSGMLIKAHDNFVIAYATHIKNEGFQRFSVAHELGHYCLEGHIDAVLPFGTDQHTSHAGFVSADRYELEADHFASGLLMPEYLFRPALRKRAVNLDAIEDLRRQCKTSLTATAIRAQELTSEPVAVIQCSQNQIEFCCMSERMMRFHPGRWPKKGDRIPRQSCAAKLHADQTRILSSERLDDEADGTHWFCLFDEVELYEETVGLGSYGRSLTILTTVDAVSDEDDEEEDDRGWNRRN